MILISALVAFSSLLLIQATSVSINYTLICNDPNPFQYTAMIMEIDNTEWTSDLIAKTEGSGVRQVVGFIAGEDGGDGSPNYEFQLRIGHNCRGYLGKNFLNMPACSTGADYCAFPMYHVVL